MSITIAVCIVGWIAGWVVLGRPRRVDELPAAANSDNSGCVVVIPARNEEASISTLLRSLHDARSRAGATPPKIVVVDDDSSDHTAALARRWDDIQVIEAPTLPPDWAGKSWALHCGVLAAEATSKDTLVFLDADVRVTPDTLDRLLDEHDRVGGLVSVQPWHETERPYEQLSALFNVVAVMGTAMGSRRQPTGAFGPVMVTSLSEYERVGGHESVKGDVVEDLALAARYRESGLPVTLLQGSSLVRFRMYPDGLAQLVEGWTKNFAVGAGATSPVRLGLIALWVTCIGSAAIAMFDGISGRGPLDVGLALYAAFAAQLAVMFRQVGRFGLLTWMLFPLPLIAFIAIFVRSLWRTHVRRSITWRGRAIPIASTRA